MVGMCISAGGRWLIKSDPWPFMFGDWKDTFKCKKDKCGARRVGLLAACWQAL